MYRGASSTMPSQNRIRARVGGRTSAPRWLQVAAALWLAGAIPTAFAGSEIVGHAILRGDGSLLIKNEVIDLFGIYLPPTDFQCRDWESPVRCASRGVLALDFKVRGFITCYPRYETDDGRLKATCYVGRTGLTSGEDLAAYLIQRGWAVATPDAPFEYEAMEKIARVRGMGVWGFTVDSYSRPRWD